MVLESDQTTAKQDLLHVSRDRGVVWGNVLLPAKIKGVHTAAYPGWGTLPADHDPLIPDGFNTFMVHNLVSDATDYTAEADNTSQLIKDYAAWAKEKQVALHLTLSFSYNVDTYDRGFEQGINASGTQSAFVSPWASGYWDYLGDSLVGFASFVAASGDTHRIDGVFWDNELYGSDPLYLNYAGWGYADSIWEAYLDDLGESPGTIAPSGRYAWIVASGAGGLDAHREFLSDSIAALASGLRERVHAVNPNFLFGVYQSPGSNEPYAAALSAGLSSPTAPLILWGTEMYMPWSSHKDAGTVGVDLLPTLVPYGEYYNMSVLYSQPIYGFYAGGFVLKSYDNETFANAPYPTLNHHLYEVGRQSTGCWVWSGLGITQTYDWFHADAGRFNSVGGFMVLTASGTAYDNADDYAARVAEYRAIFRDVNSRL
jgi:hypothetical protein